jgi:HSP20 family molecular chaperone IbpA
MRVAELNRHKVIEKQKKENKMSSKYTQLVPFNHIPSSVSLFDDLFGDGFFGPTDMFLDKVLTKAFPEVSSAFGTNPFETKAYPKVDVRETEKEYVIEAEIPGLTKDQVKVEVKDDILVIRGERRSEDKKDGKYHVKEIKRSSFIRSWTLSPDLVDKSSVAAQFKYGVLEVKINKIVPTPPPQPVVKSIEIM